MIIYGIHHSSFSIHHSAFIIDHSAFIIRHSSFINQSTIYQKSIKNLSKIDKKSIKNRPKSVLEPPGAVLGSFWRLKEDPPVIVPVFWWCIERKHHFGPKVVISLDTSKNCFFDKKRKNYKVCQKVKLFWASWWPTWLQQGSQNGAKIV